MVETYDDADLTGMFLDMLFKLDIRSAGPEHMDMKWPNGYLDKFVSRRY